MGPFPHGGRRRHGLHMLCFSCLQLDKVSFPGGANGLSEFTFCIDCKQVLYSIDIPSFAHGCLTMEGHTSSATVHLIMADPSQKTSEVCSVLKTFVDGPPPQSLCALDYKMMLEIDVPRLREIVKMARKARAEHLSICIYTRVIGCQERSLVIFAVQGESDHEEIFFNEMTRHEDGVLSSEPLRTVLMSNPATCRKTNVSSRASSRLRKSTPLSRIFPFEPSTHGCRAVCHLCSPTNWPPATTSSRTFVSSSRRGEWMNDPHT